MSRTKPKTPQIANANQADETLAEIASLTRELATIDLEMNTAIDAAKADARDKAAPIQARIKTLGDALGAYATYNKAELFTKVKTINANHGRYGFRKTSSLKPLPKLKWADVLDKVVATKGFAFLLRVKKELNKEAIRELPESQMEQLGCRLVRADEFWYEVEQDEVENVA